MKLKIGARQYNIVFSDNDSLLNDEKNSGSYGYIDYANSNIVIKNSVDSTFREENTIHEILHSLLDNSGIEDILKGTEVKTELLISILTPRFHQLLKENKELLNNLIS